jgi:peptidoglycan/xylan/chitin deacetylase (PgdA/CDA1 family)
MLLSRLAPRLYQNYVMPDRLAEYGGLLSSILKRGYRFVPMADFARAVREKESFEGPIAILRVDVDSNPCGARRMFQLERALGIRATYYFRLATIERSVIEEMAQHGTEIGYHFEELSTLARQRGFRGLPDVEPTRDELRQQFRHNFARFQRQTGISPRTIAAHGDFLNRRLGLRNNWFVDRPLMEEFRVIAEVYEPWLVSRITARVADRAAPAWWHPRSPEEALKASPAVLCLVMHPRQWVRDPWGNTVADFERVGAEVQYRLSKLKSRS